MRASKNNITSRLGVAFLALLALLLGLLFWKSFAPGFVHFSNDGPLGAQMADWMQLPQGFTGMWSDLNILGGHVGAYAPNINSLMRWILGPFGYSRFLAPLTLWIAGAGAWFFFRRLGFSTLACCLGGLAVALDSEFLSNACWGIASVDTAFGMSFLALGLVVSDSATTRPSVRWARLAVAGLAVGMAVMEAADVGAMFSMLVAAFVLYEGMARPGTVPQKFARGILRVLLIAAFAGFIAVSTVLSLVGAQIHGIAGTKQDPDSKARNWSFATQWSMPKRETLSLVVPGLFGFRMDTPKDMEMFADDFQGGLYWGSVGRSPELDRFFGTGKELVLPPGVQGGLRFMGNGFYVGVLVVLVALWAALQSFRKKDSPFDPLQRRLVWFWIGLVVVSLPLAYGRFAPFYKFIYALPYFSTVRNPIKFMHVLSFAMAVIFAYGVDGLQRRCLAGAAQLRAQGSGLWTRMNPFDRRWVIGCGAAFVLSLLSWWGYNASRQSLENYLRAVQFPDFVVGAMASFSIAQVGWFVLFLAVSAGLMTLILGGAFAGRRGKLGGILLGVLLVVDLGRANLPWLVYWDYHLKYASNPVVDILREKPYEHRVAFLPRWFAALPAKPELLQAESAVAELYNIEWTQHQFLYYNVQSLDVIQQPRLAEDLAAFKGALVFDGTANTLHRVIREWELTNTRFLLGAAGFLDFLNQQLDLVHHRFRIVQRFDIVPKAGLLQAVYPEESTAILKPDGPYALFEFSGALPRARLYTGWQTSTNDDQVLAALGSSDFDPAQKVFVDGSLPVSAASNPAGEASAKVAYVSYAPKKTVLTTQADTASVLLLNDRYDENWHVKVDGKPQPLLRCNFIMRGVLLTPGSHTVEFRFRPPMKPLYISLAAIGVGTVLLGFLGIAGRKKVAPEPTPAAPEQLSR